MYRLEYSCAIAALFLVSATPFLTSAQVAIPGTADPGQIDRRFEERPQPRALPLELPDEIDVGRLAPEGAAETRFIVQRIEIAPSTVYDASALNAYTSDIAVGDEISVAQIYEIADRITALYGNDGYILSRAFLPAQTLGDGVVQIGILEGYVDNVEIEGDDARGIMDRTSEVVMKARPFNNSFLEYYLLIANDQPGVSAQSFFRKSETEAGASTLLLRITANRSKPVGGRIGFDNRGSDTTGPLEIDGSLTFSNLSGFYDRTQLRVVQAIPTSELTFGSITHDQLLSPEGTKLTLSGSYSTSEPGGAILRAIEQESESFSGKLTLTQPIIRSRSENLEVSGAIGFRNTRSEQLGATATRDRIRTVELGLAYDFGDTSGGVNQFTATIVKGIDGLGSTDANNPFASRADGEPDFLLAEFTVSRQQQLPMGFGLNLTAKAQISADPLLSSAECGLGGESFGRAFDSSEVTGDHCLMGGIELTYQVPIEIEGLQFLQLYSFFDGGRVWNKGLSPNAGLASVGGGLRFGLGSRLTGSLEVAQPLGRDVSSSGDRDPRAFFRIGGTF